MPTLPADTEYRVRISSRAKFLRLTVEPAGRVVITVPRGFSLARAWKFVEEKETWIQQKLSRFRRHQPRFAYPIGPHSYRQHKKAAQELVMNRLSQYNSFYRLRYRGVSIRNQKTRWGSCTSRGNLQFNYQIVYLPIHLVDYLIVHELCHLAVMNHSAAYWRLVEKSIPDYQLRRRELRQLGLRPS